MDYRVQLIEGDRARLSLTAIPQMRALASPLGAHPYPHLEVRIWVLGLDHAMAVFVPYLVAKMRSCATELQFPRGRRGVVSAATATRRSKEAS
jgi:hypothetical protein